MEKTEKDTASALRIDFFKAIRPDNVRLFACDFYKIFTDDNSRHYLVRISGKGLTETDIILKENPDNTWSFEQGQNHGFDTAFESQLSDTIFEHLKTSN